MVVVKYCVPSTAPSFLPREANARLNSTPAKTPFLPRMLPTNLTTPCMPPGTSTKSPMSISCPSAMLLGEGDAPPVSALREACRAIELEEKDKLGDDSAGRRFGRRRRGVLMELPKPDILAGVRDAVAVAQGFVGRGRHVFVDDAGMRRVARLQPNKRQANHQSAQHTFTSHVCLRVLCLLQNDVCLCKGSSSQLCRDHSSLAMTSPDLDLVHGRYTVWGRGMK